MTADTTPRTGRAAPLAPPERRAAIVSATIPLLRNHGLAITTRQIAEAAGVAEGTIFSVFPDKETLIAAAVDAALDPGSTVDELLAIDPNLDLADRLAAAVEILQHHVAQTWQLLAAVGPHGQPRRHEGASNEAASRLVAAVEPLLAPATDELRRSTLDAAQALLALTVGCSHPAVVDEPMPPRQIVDVLLDGVRGAQP
jgi:AcrR family transcriptional regulator